MKNVVAAPGSEFTTANSTADHKGNNMNFATPTRGERRQYELDGVITAIKIIMASLPGVAELTEDNLVGQIRQTGLKTDHRTDAQSIAAIRFVRETLALARSLQG